MKFIVPNGCNGALAGRLWPGEREMGRLTKERMNMGEEIGKKFFH